MRFVLLFGLFALLTGCVSISSVNTYATRPASYRLDASRELRASFPDFECHMQAGPRLRSSLSNIKRRSQAWLTERVKDFPEDFQGHWSVWERLVDSS